MNNLQPFVLQSIILMAAGLSMTAYVQKNLSQEIRSIGLSRWPIVVIIAFAPWLLTNLHYSVSLYFAELIAYTYLIFFAYQARRNKAPILNLVTALAPFLVLGLMKYQPSYVNFIHSNLFISGICLSFATLTWAYLIYKKTKPALVFYILTQLIGLAILVVNYSESSLFIGLCVLFAGDALSFYMTINELKTHQTSLYEENRQYREDFEQAVEKEVKKRTFYMELSKERMLQLNRTDHLTKLLNRKSVMADINDLIFDKSVQKFVLFIFDIDHFKQINDSLGHATGDVCLKNLSACVKAQIGENDLAGRYGGDEFMIALPHKGYKEGLSFAQSLMEEISKQNNPAFSISMGMSVYPWDGEEYKRLFEIADKGLYAAKEEGRKRIGYRGYIRP